MGHAIFAVAVPSRVDKFEIGFEDDLEKIA
jgi:hypothetical protein